MTRRVVAVALAVLLCVVAVGGAVLWREARVVQSALEEARTELRQALDGQGPPADHLADARTALDRAAGATRQTVWRLGSHVPVLRRSLVTTHAIVDVATAGVELGDQVLGALADADGGDAAGADGGGVVTQLEEAETRLDGAHRQRLERTRDRLRALPTAGVLPPVRAARAQVLEQVDDVLGGLDDATAAFDVAPGLLGADGSRRYLVLMQNNAELRGAGGLPGFVAVLTAAGGELELGEPTSYDALVEQEVAFPEQVRTDAAFERRYGHVDAAGFFGNVNVDPDMPTTAPVALDQYAARTGERLDGVLALDPLALARVLEATGPIELSGSVPDAGGAVPRELDADELVGTLFVDAYLAFGGDDPDRERYLAAVAEQAFAQLLDGGLSDPGLLAGLADAARTRHLQLYSAEPAEQAVLEDLGVAGSMRAPEGSDLLAVTANNAGANKHDVHVAHTVGGTLALQLAESGAGTDGAVSATRSARLDVGLRNPLAPDDYNRYIVGSAPAEGRTFTGQTGPLALNRTWFTVWSHEDSQLRAARDAAGEDLDPVTGRLHEHLAVDHYLETPAGERSAFVVALRTPITLQATGEGELTYRLRLWRQAKAVPDELDLELLAPEGWKWAGGTVSGGEGPWFHTHADAVSTPATPVLRLGATTARVTGRMAADVDLELLLTRSDG